MDNILIIKLSSLGDIIHTLPAFSSLRKHYPGKNISWLAEGAGGDILEMVPGIDRIIVSKLKDIPRNQLFKHLAEIRREIRRPNQICLDFQGLLKSSFFSILSGSDKRLGFHRRNCREPMAALFYSDTLEPVSEEIHVIQKNMKLLQLLDIEEEHMDFPLIIPQAITDDVSAKLRLMGISDNDSPVVLNVGAAWETKRWFSESWIRLINMISTGKIPLILLWGSPEEKRLAQAIHEKTGVPPAPFLSIKEVVALIARASAVISGDTFALQVSTALARPTVGLFGPTNPNRNGPFNPLDKIAFHRRECSFCYRRSCRNPECLKDITAEEVARLFFEVIQKK